MIKFIVSNKDDVARFDHAGGPLEMGRNPRGECARHVLKDPYVSSDQLRVEELPVGRVRLENLSKRVAVQMADGTRIDPGGSRMLGLPARLTVGSTLIEVLGGALDPSEGRFLQTISQPLAREVERPGQSLAILEGPPGVEQLARWFEAVIAVQRSAASSSAFFDETARAVVELIGLDCGLVLLRRDGAWTIAGRHATEALPRVDYSRTILDRVCKDRRTFFEADGLLGRNESLRDVSTVVASPILSPDGAEVVGAVYGVRLLKLGRPGAEIRPLEAQLVQVLAAAACAGLARMGSEAEAARRHVQFEQFFSRELAGELDRDPGLLEGRDREVTILVSDIRGFSRIAEQLGARETCQLMGDVLERLTSRIHEQGGVVVDYVGDGILSMWNAPIEQHDHASRACRAALAMLGELPGLNARWEGRIGVPLSLGIGVNTGEALVGNSGSRLRLKYGPLGNTVNLSSRVEGATKQLGVPVLITGSTHAQLGGALATRRLCRARVVGIDLPVDLYELQAEQASPEWLAIRDAYEKALELYEQRRWPESSRALYTLLKGNEGNYDQPALALASRVIECLRFPTRDFDPVIELGSK